MTKENHPKRERSVQADTSRGDELDALIEDTERSIVNTQKFLEQMHGSEVENRRYVRQISENLEGSLNNLKRRRDSELERQRRPGAETDPQNEERLQT